MSALLTPRRRPRPRRDVPRPGAPQDSLFAAAPVAAPMPVPASADPVPAPAAAAVMAAAPHPSPTASARRQGPTLDDLVVGVWEGLLAGAPAECPVCATTMTPRHSAGAGVVGGRCGACGSTLG
jgi:hypothetical protein